MSNKLFIAGPDGYHNAITHHGYPDASKWHTYAYGYKLAAESLANKVLVEANKHDLLIYPIIFLYRHYLELRLKEILEQGSDLLEKPCSIPKHHDLMIIWTATKKVIQNIWPDISSSTIKEIDKILIDFIIVDKQSDSFRYPVKTNGDLTLEEFRVINLKSFVDAITPIVDELEGMSIQISVSKDRKDEMKRYEDFFRRDFI